MGKLEEAQILWDAIGNETEPEANSTHRVRNAATKIIDFITELANLISIKVDKVTGKGLSTNDYTYEAKADVENVKNKVDKIAGKVLSTHDFSTSAVFKLAKMDYKLDKTLYTQLIDKLALQDRLMKIQLDKVNDNLLTQMIFKSQFIYNQTDELILDQFNNPIIDILGYNDFILIFLATETGEFIYDEYNNRITTN